ncbi:MAG: glycosyltransferase family 4 protein [Chloroflexi bacterium]|nr:glycosyltransferase family 4 protein [Chloroflexota bacterium]
MLNWLAAHGWDVLLLVCPAADQEPSAARIRQAARAYPNIIVCQRDGRLLYRLQDGSIRLEDLRGRHPRAFSALLGEVPTNESEQRVNSLLRTVCPDVLIEVLLQVEAKWHPNVVLGEYVFMTRVFPLLDPRALKVVDTHDVFSTINRKVAQYGIDDVLALPAEAEGQLLNRADLVVAIQPEEAEVLRELTPLRNVITVGVDFRLREDMPPPDDRPIILFVGSANPKNVKGLRDFVRFAWPLVKDAMPDAELRVVGGVGHRLDTTVDGINILGHVDDLEAEYAAASVVINPAVAGTGLKVKTLESICHMRPIVVWPSGVDGMGPEIQSMCSVATNWFEFARSVIDLAKADDAIQHLVDRAAELNRLFDSDTVYAPLAAALDNAVAQPVVAGS